MLVSIITTFYNGNEYLPALLQSIQENAKRCRGKGIDIEHIIVNDSPECKPDIDHGTYTFKIRIHENVRNIGIHASRITGVSMAEGEYVIFLDQDDTLMSEAVLSHVRLLLRKTKRRRRLLRLGAEADAVPSVSVGNGYYVQQKGGHKEVIYHNIWYHRLCNRLNAVIKYGTVIISPGQCMIKKAAIPKAWLLNPVRINGADDELLWLAMLSEGCFFTVNKAHIYNHLETGKNTSDNIGQIADSSLEGIKVLRQCPGFTNHQLKLFYRRRMMKKERYTRSFFQRAWVNIKNIDLSFYIIGVKLLKQVF